MSTPPVGFFQIRKIDSLRFEIRKNHIISQTYIAGFKSANDKIIVNLPWQFRFSKSINIYLDDNEDYSVLEERVKTEKTPKYLFINDIKVLNTGIINIAWEEILK